MLEPFAIAALMQIYFRAKEGQIPGQDWRSHLDEVSSQFRELGQQARAYVRAPDSATAGAGRSPNDESGPPPPAPPPA